MAGGPKCREALSLLQDYLKEEITPENAAKITEHLEKCRPCFEHLQFEKRFLEMLEHKARGQCCPDRLRARILTELRSELDSSAET
ncbi:MAG TPA: zf-HC2 domain-containing protein [Gemmatimonadales bacterium]|jgi:anti-sigma factor (TIGR02949 family)|nr:zf-HC2 domain-containing protein [Gemmatimonadales bacterium]HXS24113.1 zf-HC2 domain-containing protein [Gemmatimonadales bacterium]